MDEKYEKEHFIAVVLNLLVLAAFLGYSFSFAVHWNYNRELKYYSKNTPDFK
jgi:hypothetical protein